MESWTTTLDLELKFADFDTPFGNICVGTVTTGTLATSQIMMVECEGWNVRYTIN